MGHIRKELGIKSVSGISKYLKNYLSDNGYGKVDLDCVKVANSVRCFWAVNNTLHKLDIKGHNIYIIDVEDLNTLALEITKTLRKTHNDGFNHQCHKCKSYDCDNIGNRWRCNNCNERWIRSSV